MSEKNNLENPPSKLGRPKKFKRGTAISVRLDAADLALWQAAAEAKGQPLTVWLRETARRAALCDVASG